MIVSMKYRRCNVFRTVRRQTGDSQHPIVENKKIRQRNDGLTMRRNVFVLIVHKTTKIE